MWKRIGQQSPFSADLAKRILGWVTFSARPLTVVELQGAIAVEIGEPEFNETKTDIEEMTSVCSGLIIVGETSNIVKLIHFTAEEYLKRNWKSWFTNIHEHLTDTCLIYLSFDSFDKDSCASQDCLQVPREEYPFYQYLAHELRSHLRQSLGNDVLLHAFIRNDAKGSRCMRAMSELSVTEYTFRGLQLASLFGLEHILDAFSFDSNFNVWDYLGRTPLTWAAGSGNEKVVNLLLDRGADPNSTTKEGFTPIFYDAAYGHGAVVSLLIGRGAYVNFANRDNETPIFFAARGGDQGRLGPSSLFTMGDRALVLRLLLDAGADIDQKISIMQPPCTQQHKMAIKIAVKLQ